LGLPIEYQEDETGKVHFEHLGNPPDAKDFVSGMLSMSYLTEDFEDNSDQAVLDRMLNTLPGIGPKSAMCLLAFQLKRPVFVVDVHVLRFSKWLGWLPRWAGANDAMMYLHNCIPEDIRYDFHNQIWTHCANENVREARGRAMVCPFCGSNPPPRGRYLDVKCPLDPYLVPLRERWAKGYLTAVEEDAEGVDTGIYRDVKEQKQQQKLRVFFNTGKNEPKAEQSSSESDSQIPLTRSSHLSSITPSRTIASPLKSLTQTNRFKPRRTMLLHEVTPEQAQEHGYLLWEFQPMDNSFGEDWGTFEDLPRFKWEKPSIMDSDVAVSLEYAESVLAGQTRHRWWRISGQEESAMEAASAMSAMME